MTEEVLLTREGYEKLKAELDELVSVTRQEVSRNLQVAREFGDLSENAEYDAAKNEQAEVEARIAKLEAMLRQAKIIEEGQMERGKVNVGNTVLVKDKKGKEKEFAIVGASEADPFAGKISNESAVGGGLLGHKVGDKVDIETPGGKVVYEILKISKSK